MMRWRVVWVLLVVGMVSGFAVDRALPDAAQEARAQHLFQQLKCVVCAGQPLDESDAMLAVEMRTLIRAQIAAGNTDEAIVEYLKARYGEEMSTRPQWSTKTAVLWAAPFLLLAIGALVLLLPKKAL